MSNLGDNFANHLKNFIERIEKLEEEKQTYVDDIRDVYKEAKDAELDGKALRRIIRIRKQDADKRKAEEDILDSYMHALGMI